MVNMTSLASLVLVLVSLACTANAQVDDAANSASSSTGGKNLCKIDEAQPAYMPNIYWCSKTERCCENEGLPSCCGTNITTDAIMEQVLMWLALIALLFIVGCTAYCYFNDHYCCGSGQEADEDGATGCFCCKTQAQDRYRKRFDGDSAFFPDVVKQNRVDDPIFGRLGKPEDVPAYAHIDRDLRRDGRYL